MNPALTTDRRIEALPRLSPRAIAAVAGVVTFATFFIVEHSFTSSLYAEAYDAENFEDVELDSMVEGGDSLRRLGFAVFGGMGAVLLFTRGMRLPTGTAGWWVAGAAIAYCSASVLWSIDPTLAAKRVAILFLVAAGLGGLLRHLGPADAAKWITWMAAAYVGLGVLCEIGLGQFRPWQSGYRFGGTTHPNTQGVICGLLVCSLLSQASIRRRQTFGVLVGLALAVVFLYLTKSRTSLAAAGAGCGVLLMLRASVMTRIGGAVAFITLLAGGLFAATVAEAGVVDDVLDIVLLGRGEEAATLTGRIPLWTELAGSVAARPVLGHGYGSFWTPETVYRVSASQGWQPSHAHSAYVETALNLGLVGVLLGVASLTTMLLVAARSDRLKPSAAAGLTVAFAVFAAVYSVADTGFVLPTFGSFAVGLLLLQSGRLPYVRSVPE